MRRKGRAIATVAILLIVGAIGIAWLNPRLTSLHRERSLSRRTGKRNGKGSAFSQRAIRAHSPDWVSFGNQRWLSCPERVQSNEVDGCARDHGKIQSIRIFSPTLAAR